MDSLPAQIRHETGPYQRLIKHRKAMILSHLNQIVNRILRPQPRPMQAILLVRNELMIERGAFSGTFPNWAAPACDSVSTISRLDSVTCR